jgi:hypothetical protein
MLNFLKNKIEFVEPNATPIKPSFFYNNSQDSHNYSNSAKIGSILGAPNQAGTTDAATSTPPSRIHPLLRTYHGILLSMFTNN